MLLCCNMACRLLLQAAASAGVAVGLFHASASCFGDQLIMLNSQGARPRLGVPEPGRGKGTAKRLRLLGGMPSLLSATASPHVSCVGRTAPANRLPLCCPLPCLQACAWCNC